MRLPGLRGYRSIPTHAMLQLKLPLAAAWLLAAPLAQATVRLPALVGSHMVLQRGLLGWAVPGVVKGSRALQGFSVAGADRQFNCTTARLVGNEVVVQSAAVPSPVAVRYDWADSPNGNLCNKDGLPAVPFRTDTWPGITYGRR